MNILRTFDSIIENVWGDKDSGNCITNTSSPVPLYEEWDYNKKVDILDIKIWEQLYHDPGNLGLFASWSPYIEYYILIYYPFLDTDAGIVTYYGKDACYDVAAVMREISINFEVSRISLPSVAI
jgi:hypothetical protein